MYTRFEIVVGFVASLDPVINRVFTVHTHVHGYPTPIPLTWTQSSYLHMNHLTMEVSQRMVSDFNQIGVNRSQI